jgi:TRAP-type C4-dicarboxylate transport system permease small subunit
MLRAGLEGAVGAVMLAAVLLNLANVIARYVFSSPIAAAEEILQFMDVWVVMLGAAVIVREHRHLNMDLLHQAMPPAWRRRVDRVVTVVEVALALYVIAQAGRIIALLHGNGIRSVTAGIPLALMYLSMPLGFGCGVIFLLARLRSTRSAIGPSASNRGVARDGG